MLLSPQTPLQQSVVALFLVVTVIVVLEVHRMAILPHRKLHVSRSLL